MRKISLALAALVLVATTAAGQTPKVYPGASKYTPPDTPENREMLKAMPPDIQSSYYVTNDSFEKVVAFYKAVGKEYVMPGFKAGRKLPNGQELKQAFFIFDGEKDLTTSKNWAKIQRPLIGSFDKGFQPRDVQDVTSITLVRKK